MDLEQFVRIVNVALSFGAFSLWLLWLLSRWGQARSFERVGSVTLMLFLAATFYGSLNAAIQGNRPLTVASFMTTLACGFAIVAHFREGGYLHSRHQHYKENR